MILSPFCAPSSHGAERSLARGQDSTLAGARTVSLLPSTWTLSGPPHLDQAPTVVSTRIMPWGRPRDSGSFPGAWPAAEWPAWVESSSPRGFGVCLLTFGDPSIQAPGVESVIKINPRQTATPFPGLPEFSLFGERQRAEMRSGIPDLPLVINSATGVIGCSLGPRPHG